MKLRIPFLLANLLGVGAFALPFVIAINQGDAGYSARSQDAYWILAVFVPIAIAVAVSEAAAGRLDAKLVALLGVLCACAAVLRLPISFAGANLFFILPITGGFVFGPVFGFLLGALGMAASGFISGGIGPWLPFQMFAAGWVGAGAGLLVGFSRSAGRARMLILAAYGYLAAFFYGAVTSLYFWPLLLSGDASIGWQPGIGILETARRYYAFYVVTSLAWDAIGAFTNAVVLMLVGLTLTRALKRFKSRFAFEIGSEPPGGEVHVDISRGGETDQEPLRANRNRLVQPL